MTKEGNALVTDKDDMRFGERGNIIKASSVCLEGTPDPQTYYVVRFGDGMEYGYTADQIDCS